MTLLRDVNSRSNKCYILSYCYAVEHVPDALGVPSSAGALPMKELCGRHKIVRLEREVRSLMELSPNEVKYICNGV